MNFREIKKNINVLIVDDHPFIVDAYTKTLDFYKPDECTVVTFESNTGRGGYDLIHNTMILFEIAFLDINIPKYLDKGIISGMDLALLLREKMPKCKIVLLTMHDERLIFDYIFEKIKPEGLVIKNDLSFKGLLEGFSNLVENGTYYSETILKLIENQKDKTSNPLPTIAHFNGN